MTDRQISCMCQGHLGWTQTAEHAELTEASQIRMAARTKGPRTGPLTASAERAQSWFEDKWNAWQARLIIDSLPPSEVAQAEQILNDLKG